MANVNITSQGNEITQIKLKNNKQYYFKDEAARTAVSNIQVSLNNNYSTTSLSNTALAANDSFETAIGKLHTELKNDEIKLNTLDGLVDQKIDSIMNISINIDSNIKLYKKIFTDISPDDINENNIVKLPAYVHVFDPNNEFNISLLTIAFDNKYTGYPYAICDHVEFDVNSGSYVFMLEPKFVGSNINFSIYYNNVKKAEGTCDIYLKHYVTNKTTAFSIIALDDDGIMSIMDVVESFESISQIRAQSKMVNNDPLWGLFGDLVNFDISEGSCYKIYARTNFTDYIVLNFGNKPILLFDTLTFDIANGYNWINYPFEFDITPDNIVNIFNDFTPNEGDQIYCMCGCATYYNNKWYYPYDFVIKAGSAFIYRRFNQASTETKTYNRSLSPINISNDHYRFNPFKRETLNSYFNGLFTINDQSSYIFVINLPSDYNNIATNMIIGVYDEDYKSYIGWGSLIDVTNVTFYGSILKYTTGHTISFRKYIFNTNGIGGGYIGQFTTTFVMGTNDLGTLQTPVTIQS